MKLTVSKLEELYSAKKMKERSFNPEEDRKTISYKAEFDYEGKKYIVSYKKIQDDGFWWCDKNNLYRDGDGERLIECYEFP